MLKLLMNSFPLIIGLNLSPGPLLLLFMILMTPKAKINAYAYLSGWFIGLFLTEVFVAFTPDFNIINGNPQLSLAVTRIVLGILCFVFVWFEWLNKSKSKNYLSVSRLFKKLDELNIWRSVLLGVFFTIMAFKNLLLSAYNAIYVKSQLNNTTEILWALFIFAVLSSLSFLILILAYSLLYSRIENTLYKLKMWLTNKNSQITIGILSFVGLFLIFEGLLVLSQYYKSASIFY